MTDSVLIRTLAENLGAQAVLTGTDVTSRARHVWDPATIDAAAIVRPRDTAELAEGPRRARRWSLTAGAPA